MLIALQSDERAVFLFGFAKSELDNISPKELATLRELAQGWLAARETKIEAALNAGLLTELDDDDEDCKS